MSDELKSSRDAPQMEGRHEAVLIDSQGREIPVVMIDMADSGFRLESPGSHFVGELICLRVGPHGQYPAEIRWVSGSHAGGIFSD